MQMFHRFGPVAAGFVVVLAREAMRGPQQRHSDHRHGLWVASLQRCSAQTSSHFFLIDVRSKAVQEHEPEMPLAIASSFTSRLRPIVDRSIEIALSVPTAIVHPLRIHCRAIATFVHVILVVHQGLVEVGSSSDSESVGMVEPPTALMQRLDISAISCKFE